MGPPKPPGVAERLKAIKPPAVPVPDTKAATTPPKPSQTPTGAPQRKRGLQTYASFMDQVNSTSGQA